MFLYQVLSCGCASDNWLPFRKPRLGILVQLWGGGFILCVQPSGMGVSVHVCLAYINVFCVCHGGRVHMCVLLRTEPRASVLLDH